MATVLQPIVVLVQLRTELRGLQADADGVGIAIWCAAVRRTCAADMAAAIRRASGVSGKSMGE